MVKCQCYQCVAVVVQPAVVVSGAVGEELALHVVLADGLAVRGGVHVLDVHYLVLWALLTGEPVEEVALTGKVLLTIVTVVQVGEGSSVDTVLLPVAAVVIWMLSLRTSLCLLAPPPRREAQELFFLFHGKTW